MTKTAKTKLAILADFLQHKVKPKWFYLGNWASAGFTERKCGTTACAAGWATVAFPNQGLTLTSSLYDKSSMELVYENYESTDAAAAFFDIDRGSADFLFDPNYYLPGQRNKRHVVQRIRQMVKTGCFDLYGDSETTTGWKSPPQSYRNYQTTTGWKSPPQSYRNYQNTNL